MVTRLFPFPTIFSKAFYFKVIKSQHCEVNDDQILDLSKLKASAHNKIESEAT